MKRTDEELDNLFKEAAAKIAVPPFDDAFFSEIEAQLPAENKKRRFIWIWFSGIAALLCLIATFIFREDSISKPILKAQKTNSTSAESPFEFETESTTKLSSSSQKDVQQINNKSASKPSGTKNFKISRTSKGKPSQSDELSERSTLTTEEIKQFNQLTKTEQELEFYPYRNYVENIPLITSVNEELSFVGTLNPLQVKRPAIDRPERAIVAANFKKPVKTWPYYIQLALGSGEGLMLHPGTKQPMSNLAAEIGYLYRIQNWQFEAGIQYMLYRPIDVNPTRSSIVYGVDINRWHQEMNYSAISILEIPIRANYRIQRHSLALGIVPGYNLGSTIAFRKWKNDSQLEDAVYYFNPLGTNRFSIRPDFMYRFDLYRGFSLGLNLSTQLIHPIKTGMINEDYNKLPVFGQFIIRKSLR